MDVPEAYALAEADFHLLVMRLSGKPARRGITEEASRATLDEHRRVLNAKHG